MASSIQELLDQHARGSILLAALTAPSLVPALSATDWVQAVSAAATVTKSELEWLSKDDRLSVQYAVMSYVKKALTEFYPRPSVSNSEMKTALGDFTDWIASQDDRHVLDFAWAVMEYQPRRQGTSALDPVRWLRRSGRLARDLAYDCLELAITFRDEAESRYWWPDERWELADWERDSQVYIQGMSHPSYVVRAWAAKVLGCLYLNCARSRRPNTPPIAEILQWIHEQQLIHAGVAGAFLDGAGWSIEMEDWSTLLADLDLRFWFLETLRLAKPESEIPHVQTIEFYAHEFFDLDEDAIREMLRMGRKYLAVMTATDRPEAIDQMSGVLHEMANSDDANVARAIQEYLKVGAHHAGLRYMPERD
jgi:hypothetical protein